MSRARVRPQRFWRSRIAVTVAGVALALLQPLAAMPATPDASRATVPTALEMSAWAPAELSTLDPDVFRLALRASRCAVAAGRVASPVNLTVIDYSLPSLEKRLWVFDLQTRTLLYEEMVSHGQGSGGNLATRFSNTPDSHQSSVGLFVTASTYIGRNGYSLRLDGLDQGFNDRARERAIVMHGASYVNDQIGRSLGRLGRSHGCPALREPVARELIDRIKDGNLVFSYYPDEEWLKSSRFLGTCR